MNLDAPMMEAGRPERLPVAKKVAFALGQLGWSLASYGAANATVNGIWLFVCVTLLYWFMTMYLTPCYAWMSELGHEGDERLQLSTMISITWVLGAMIGAQAPTRHLHRRAALFGFGALRRRFHILHASFACYLPVAAVARKVGRRRLLIAEFLLFSLAKRNGTR